MTTQLLPTDGGDEGLTRTLLGQLIAEISRFGGASKENASRLARILLPCIEDYANSHTDKAVLEGRIEEREHTWKLINDIRYQNVSLDFAKSVSLERLSEAQVDEQLKQEALQQQQKGKTDE